jgi:hypothetical protein
MILEQDSGGDGRRGCWRKNDETSGVCGVLVLHIQQAEKKKQNADVQVKP